MKSSTRASISSVQYDHSKKIKGYNKPCHRVNREIIMKKYKMKQNPYIQAELYEAKNTYYAFIKDANENFLFTTAPVSPPLSMAMGVNFSKFKKSIRGNNVFLDIMLMKINDDEGHIFFCFIDKKKKTIETVDEKEVINDEDRKILSISYRTFLIPFFRKLFGENYTYIHHNISILTRIVFVIKNQLNISIEGGICFSYSNYFKEQKLKYPSRSLKTIVWALIKRATTDPEKYVRYITGYAQRLTNL